MSNKKCPLKKTESYGTVTFGFCERMYCGFFNEYHMECGFSALGAISFAIMKQKGDEVDGTKYTKD